MQFEILENSYDRIIVMIEKRFVICAKELEDDQGVILITDMFYLPTFYGKVIISNSVDLKSGWGPNRCTALSHLIQRNTELLTTYLNKE